MKIKSSGAFILAMSVVVLGQAAFAQKPAQPVIPANAVATPGTPAPQTQAPAANSASAPGEMKGNLEFDALGFKGSIHFDGNPLSVLQQPNQSGQPPAGGAVPMQPQMVAPNGQPVMMAPMQQGMMMPAQTMQQMPMQQMPMQQMPMQQMPMQQMPMQQMPMQQMPMQTMMPMQQMAPMQPMMQQMQPMAQAAPAAPAAPMIDLSGVAKAASALAPKVINALPSLGLPAAPAFIDQSSKVIQSIFPGNKQGTQPQQQMGAMNPMQPMMQQMPMTMNSAPMQDAGVDVLTALDQYSKAVKYNLEMTQEAAYLASFGDPTMRATSALEAQKNATEARATADRAAGLAGNYGGEAAQILASIRAGAAQAQSLADQARAASNNSNGLAP